jgi:hypothetical protein
MKFRIVIIGITFALFGMYAYRMIPPLITKAMNKLTLGNEQSSMANQIFSQLGMPPIPSTPEITAFVQYCCIGLAIAGVGIIIFGMASKKTLTTVKISLESDQRSQDDDINLKAINLLQERLAKGEITSSQYQNLRKMLEEKR